MVWEVIQKCHPAESPYPEVSVSRTGLYFNIECAKRIGYDKTDCIVVVDRKLFKIGLWFFKNKPTLPNGMRPSDAYKVKQVVNTQKLVVQFKVLKKVPGFKGMLGVDNRPKRFLLEREPNEDFGKDFFVVNLGSNATRSGFGSKPEEE